MTGSASKPGIHNHHREYGFRACAKRRILKCAIAHRGMTTENKNAPVSRGVSHRQISAKDEPRYAAAFSAEPSTTCGATALAVVIGMLRGFLASGISRTRSTWSRPFSSEAFFTATKSASWNARSNARAALPRYRTPHLALAFSLAAFSPLLVCVL